MASPGDDAEAASALLQVDEAGVGSGGVDSEEVSSCPRRPLDFSEQRWVLARRGALLVAGVLMLGSAAVAAFVQVAAQPIAASPRLGRKAAAANRLFDLPFKLAWPW